MNLAVFGGGALLMGFVLSVPAKASTSVIALQAGPDAVGIRVIKQYDYTREFKAPIDPVTGQIVLGERGRPMQTLIWYPAKPSASKLTYGDYVRTRVTEQQFELPVAEESRLFNSRRQALASHVGEQEIAQVLSAPMSAEPDAEPLPGRFPVVLYAAGAGGAADENADLCEYLASHGYVVVASTSLGTHTKSIAYALEDAESQARDIEFLLAYSRSLPQADTEHVAALGWSWGGMNNVLAASRDKRISATVSFDGTREPAFTKLIPVQQLTAPWLYISRTPDTIPQINKSEIDTTFSLLNEAKYADVYQLTMYPMKHVDFVSRHLRESTSSDFGEYSKAEVAQAYSTVAQYVLAFLNATLKSDVESQAFLHRTPRENGVPAHTMAVDIHQREALPPSQASMAAELARDGYAKTSEVYDAARRKDETFQLSASELKAWGYGLLGRDQARAAIEVLKLWLSLYPSDWDAADSLAEAYDAAGDTSLAIRYYKRSLELNPGNINAENQLKAMAARAP